MLCFFVTASLNAAYASKDDEYDQLGYKSPVTCEEKYPWTHYGVYKGVQSCIMNTQKTRIDSPFRTFSDAKDESIKGMDFNGNKYVYYLPIRTYEKFPNIVVYDASGCSLKAIKRENFEGLTKLESLDLRNNNLVRIQNDTFGDLKNLTYLSLGEPILTTSLIFLN